VITVGKFRRDLIVLADNKRVASCDTLNEVDECHLAIMAAAPQTKAVTYQFNQDIAWAEDEHGNTISPNR